jgi:hypothetical protein
MPIILDLRHLKIYRAPDYFGVGFVYLRRLSLPFFNLNPKETPEELFGREKEIEELIRLCGEQK